MASCRGFLECLLKLLNFPLTVSGLAIIGYGIYMLIEWIRFSPGSGDYPISPVIAGAEIWKLGRRMLLVTTLSDSVFDKLSTAWFIYTFIGIGVILFVISLFGYIGAVTRNVCCLSCYAFSVLLLILLELGVAAFIYCDHDWKDLIPRDNTGRFDMIYGFLKENWEIVKKVAVGAFILEAYIFLLAILVREENHPANYDSDGEYISLTQRLRRIDAMCRKYGLDPPQYNFHRTLRTRL